MAVFDFEALTEKVEQFNAALKSLDTEFGTLYSEPPEGRTSIERAHELLAQTGVILEEKRDAERLVAIAQRIIDAHQAPRKVPVRVAELRALADRARTLSQQIEAQANIVNGTEMAFIRDEQRATDELRRLGVDEAALNRLIDYAHRS